MNLVHKEITFRSLEETESKQWPLNSSHRQQPPQIVVEIPFMLRVATVPLKAAVGPPQLIMSMAYSLNLQNLQHFIVLIKPSSPIPQEVTVFDFQPRNPESIEAAVSVLSRKSIPGVILQRKLKNIPRKKCWKVGSSKDNALEMAKEFNRSWETNLKVGVHDCRHYTNEFVQHLTGEIQIVEQIQEANNR